MHLAVYVITAGMLRALSQPERQVLLAHERAHASSLHYLFTTVARLAAAANPLLRPVASAVGYTVERWADGLRSGDLTGRLRQRGQLRGTVTGGDVLIHAQVQAGHRPDLRDYSEDQHRDRQPRADREPAQPGAGWPASIRRPNRRMSVGGGLQGAG